MRFSFPIWCGFESSQNEFILPPSSALVKKAALTCAFLLLFFTFTFNANAANYTVNTLADNESNGCVFGNCTLREAVSAANLSLGADSIIFSVTGTITLQNGHLPISSSMTITGAGARSLSVNGNNVGRVFLVSGSGTIANINNLTITNGNAQPILIGTTLVGDGGGILNTQGATLNLSEVHVNGNSATSHGGGIATVAVLPLTATTTTKVARSAIFDNSAIAGGGGVSSIGVDVLGTGLLSSADTEFTNSTITQNSATAEGGGISNIGGNTYLTNNTISHNQSTIAGGGIANVSGLLIGSIYMRNNILAQNNALIGLNLVGSDGFGIFSSLGNNLIGNNFDVIASFPSSLLNIGQPQPNLNNDLVGSLDIGLQTINPLLTVLGNNGGTTDTRAISSNSLAFNRGNNCVVAGSCFSKLADGNFLDPLPTDQRGTGFPRNTFSTVDMGAYESQLAPTAANVSVGGRVSDSFDRIVTNARVVVTNQNGISRTAFVNSFGFYHFDDIPAGETYVFQVIHRKLSFAPQVIGITENVSDLNFTNNREAFKR